MPGGAGGAEGQRWGSPEAFFQARKFKGVATAARLVEKIRVAEGGTCWSLGQVHTYVSHTAVFRVYAQSSRSLIFPGQTRDFPIVADWEEIKVDVMYVANRLKFQQNKVG